MQRGDGSGQIRAAHPVRQRTASSRPSSTAGDSASEAGSSGRELPPWNAPGRIAPSFNRLEQMARTIGELQSEVVHWKHASQVGSYFYTLLRDWPCMLPAAGDWCMHAVLRRDWHAWPAL